MKSNQWTKTLLYVYKYFNRITDAIDKIVEKKAMNTFFYTHNQKTNGVLENANEIINLIERKKRLINLKVLVDQCLISCDEDNAQILIGKFIDNEISEAIANRMNLGIRTFFRKQEVAEKQFYTHMVRLGFDDEALRKYIADEKWIFEVYSKYELQEEEDTKNACIRALQRFAKSNHPRQTQNSRANVSL